MQNLVVWWHGLAGLDQTPAHKQSACSPSEGSSRWLQMDAVVSDILVVGLGKEDDSAIPVLPIYVVDDSILVSLADHAIIDGKLLVVYWQHLHRNDLILRCFNNLVTHHRVND